MESQALRWGILGTANIARKNWKAIWNSKNGVVAAVASRDVERSRSFIGECQAQAPFATVPHALGSYQELVASPDIDAVYVPLPTALRKSWVIRAAETGKHVVCEKPCAISTEELKEMLDACRRNGVQFLDGVMFMHSRRLDSIRDVLEDGRVLGQVRRITSSFTWNQEEEFFRSNIRARSELEPDGCLGDLGWYCIRFALWVMNSRLPRQVAGRVLAERRHPQSKAAVPIEFSGELFFEDGISSSFYCSFITEIEQSATVSGNRGSLRVPDFVLPACGEEVVFETSSPVFQVQGCDFSLDPRVRRWTVGEPSHGEPSAQETNLFRQFADQVRSGTLSPSWPDIALKTQQVMQACRESASTQGRLVELVA